MPHWLYWAGLLLFPLIALYLVRRQLRKPLPSGPLAVHRLSVLADCRAFSASTGSICAARWGFVFIPVLPRHPLLQRRSARGARRHSRTFAALESAQHNGAVARRERSRAPCRRPRPHSISAQADVKKSQTEYDAAKAVTDHWVSW